MIDLVTLQRRASAVLTLAAWVASQPLSAADLAGRLHLVDTGPFTTRVEYLGVALRSLDQATVIRAQPDSTGRFTLKDMVPGRYQFDLPFPGYFVSVAIGTRSLSLPEFKWNAEDTGPLEITVSMKTSELSVEVRGLPRESAQTVALLVPADPKLTLGYSCILNRLSGSNTEFKSVPLGTYRLLIVDDAVKSDVSGYAPRFPDFLREQARPFVINGDGGTEVTAMYVDAATVQEAIRRAGPLRP